MRGHGDVLSQAAPAVELLELSHGERPRVLPAGAAAPSGSEAPLAAAEAPSTSPRQFYAKQIDDPGAAQSSNTFVQHIMVSKNLLNGVFLNRVFLFANGFQVGQNPT